MMFHRIVVGMTVATDAAVGVGAEQVFLADEFGERGSRCGFIGNALNKHPLVGRTVFPARLDIHVGELAVTQRLSDLAQGGAFAGGLDDKVREAGDVVGIGTKELGHC